MTDTTRATDTDDEGAFEATLAIIIVVFCLFANMWLRCQIWWLILSPYGIRGLTMAEMFGLSLLVGLARGQTVPKANDKSAVAVASRAFTGMLAHCGAWGMAVLISWAVGVGL